MASPIQGLYAIADSQWNPCERLSQLALLFLEGGAKIIQLRMKGVEREKLLSEAAEIARLKRNFAFTFIVNDAADVAGEVGADGVHVGAHDTKVSEIRKRFGKNLLIGYSSHSIEEALSAQDQGADYVAFGAIFPTKTKGPGHPVQGIRPLQELVALTKLPVVAIGGIGRKNISKVVRTGVKAVAMITGLSESPDIPAEVRWYVDAIARLQREFR